MALMRLTSPHAHGPMSTQRVMQNVLLATIPGIIVLTHFSASARWSIFFGEASWRWPVKRLH